MNVTIDILSFFTCAFNIIGILFIMNDGLYVLEVYQKLELKKKIICFVGLSFMAFLVVHTGINLVFFLIVEYFVVLAYNKQEHPQAALWGINSILSILVTEFIIVMLFYCKENNNLSNDEIQMVTYLGMATTGFFWIVVRESRKIGKGFKKMLMIALEVKAIENIIWLDICIWGSLFERDYISMTLLFVFAIFLCYIVFFIVAYKIFERDEIEKRADIHIDTYEYYLHMEEEHRQIRKMYHDMKNQLMIMETENEENHINQQIQNVSKKLDNLHQFYHTGFNSLDILLFDGKRKAEKKGITFEAVISEGCLSFMKEEDVNVVFSNAIVNAIEACEKIEGGVLNQ